MLLSGLKRQTTFTLEDAMSESGYGNGTDVLAFQLLAGILLLAMCFSLETSVVELLLLDNASDKCPETPLVPETQPQTTRKTNRDRRVIATHL